MPTVKPIPLAASEAHECIGKTCALVPSMAQDTIADESDDGYDEVTDSESEDSMSMSEADTTLSV